MCVCARARARVCVCVCVCERACIVCDVRDFIAPTLVFKVHFMHTLAMELSCPEYYPFQINLHYYIAGYIRAMAKSKVVRCLFLTSGQPRRSQQGDSES